jgi:hypothetical protein
MEEGKKNENTKTEIPRKEKPNDKYHKFYDEV